MTFTEVTYLTDAELIRRVLSKDNPTSEEVELADRLADLTDAVSISDTEDALHDLERVMNVLEDQRDRMVRRR